VDIRDAAWMRENWCAILEARFADEEDEDLDDE